MIPRRIQSPLDLVTPHEHTVEGFLDQAVRKTEEATPYVKTALELYEMLRDVQHVDDLRQLAHENHRVRRALLSAAGLSNKAQKHLSEEQLEDGIARAFAHAEEASDLRTSVFARYLLTRGDALGGRMRNIIGHLGEDRLTDVLLDQLEKKNITPSLAHSSGRTERINRIAWNNRILFFNITPAFIGKNIDLILADAAGLEDPEEARSDSTAYLACGEIKGGIDPAGADEHWKTARSALNRIRSAFQNTEVSCPPLFFAGAAITSGVADDIFRDLKSSQLTHAANLTAELQIQDLTRWLLAL